MLPICHLYPDLLHSLQQHARVLLQAPPGAGKSTWLPLQLLRDGHYRHIVMLEPRRLAARTIAAYLADCQNEKVGDSIGLRMRQEKRISAATRLEIVTEGMLTRMLQADPALTGIDLLIFDEFHERSLAADTALAFALESQATLRDDLAILLMSATLDSSAIASRLDCTVLCSEGRSFPVDEIYQPLADEQRWLDAIAPLVRRALAEQAGNCLVFLPGQREIQAVQRALADLPDDCIVVPLYGEQNREQQLAAIRPPAAGKRKVVLATNVAETSLTIDGIRIVIDSGKRRAALFNLNTGVSELKTVNTSMASSIQRAGRAGRTQPGVVYRLGSQERFRRREAHDTPAILASDISGLLLESKLWGTPIDQLALLDMPSRAQQQQAEALLRMLEAIDDNGRLTDTGKALPGYGSDIRLAHMLHRASQLDASQPGLLVTAVWLLALMDSRCNSCAELVDAIDAQQRQLQPAMRQQLRYWQQRLKIDSRARPDTRQLPLLLALAWPDRLARRRGNGFLLANGAGVQARDGQWPDNEWLAIAELGGEQGQRIFSATAFDPAVLQQQLPHLFREQTVCEYDERQQRFIYQQRLMLGAITVNARPAGGTLDAGARTAAWLALVRKHGLALFNSWTDKAADQDTNDTVQLQIRQQLAHQLMAEDFPPSSEADLLATLDDWLAPFIADAGSLEQLKKTDLAAALQQRLSWPQQQALEALLPARIRVPSGSQIRLRYQAEGPARLAVRMQEVFGLSETPQLANGRLPLLMDLLSPAQRSLQLTGDLAGFWQGSYREVQKEMKSRYPKHYWPDDPASAEASRHSVKKR